MIVNEYVVLHAALRLPVAELSLLPLSFSRLPGA